MVKKINTRRKTRKTLKRRYQKKSKRRYQKKSKRRSRKMRGGASAGGEQTPSGEIKFHTFIEQIDPNNLVELEAIRAELLAEKAVEDYNKNYARTHKGQNTLESLIKALKSEYKAPLTPQQENKLEIILFQKILVDFDQKISLTKEIVEDLQKQAQLAKAEVLKKA